MLKFLLIVSLVFVSSLTLSAQSRVTASFDKDWLFLRSDSQGVEQPTFDDSTWRKVDVPHDWSIEGPFDAKNPTGGAGGFLPAGIGWYRKHFTLPATQSARRVFIEFDGVMANSDVWINNFHLGRRPYGYVSFGYDLSDHLNFGKDNVIAVRADNSGQPASRWYTGAGIYRHVRLVTIDAVHLATWSAFVTTPRIDKNSASIVVSSEIVNQGSTAQPASLEVDILDPQGKRVGHGASPSAPIGGGQTFDASTRFGINNPQLWDIGNGILYKAVVRVRSNGKTLDEQIIPFGIREFHFDPATGFWLNGKNFKIKGACLHHDGSAFGAAVPLAVWERRLNELRKLGVNAIRNSHNPAGDFLDLADRMGFLVMDELFDQWTLPKNPYDYHLYFNEWS
ncbi:MAG: sugar-binding domain-containing protein, partial [Acidobacteriota bacterium]